MATLAPINTQANDMRPAGQDAHNPLMRMLMALLTDPTMGALLGGGFNVRGAASPLLKAIENPEGPVLQGYGEASPFRQITPTDAMTGGGAIDPETFESVLSAIIGKYGSLRKANTAQTMQALTALRESLGHQFGAKGGGGIQYNFKQTIANPKLPD